MEVDLGSSTKLLTKKGYLDFYLVLRKKNLAQNGNENKTALPQQEKPAGSVQNNNTKNTTTETPEKTTLKKPRFGPIKNKVKSILDNN